MKIEVFDQSLLNIIDPESQLERVASGFIFVEGPVWDRQYGNLIFSDIIGDGIYRWDADFGISVFRKPSFMTNGNTIDQFGQLISCEHASSRLTRTRKTGEIEILASHYQDHELNSPNDVVVHSSGSIYFTDPNSGRSEKYGVLREQELDYQGVYRLANDGSLTLLVDDFVKPNGICFSLDESQIFINDSAYNHIRVFDVDGDGLLHNGKIWAGLQAVGVGVADGMKLDQAGNLYCTGPGGIHIYSPKANYLGIIKMPEHSTNLAWGGEQMDFLFITAATSVYCIRPLIPGPQQHLDLVERHKA